MSKESKSFRAMTPAEQDEVQDKMNILHKLGFFIDDCTKSYPAITHELFDFILSFDLSILELTDFIPLVYNLGKSAGKNEQYGWGGWDRWGNHEATGSKFNQHGFTQDGPHQNGTRYDSAGYDMQGRDRSGNCPEVPF